MRQTFLLRSSLKIEFLSVTDALPPEAELAPVAVTADFPGFLGIGKPLVGLGKEFADRGLRTAGQLQSVEHGLVHSEDFCRFRASTLPIVFAGCAEIVAVVDETDGLPGIFAQAARNTQHIGGEFIVIAMALKALQTEQMVST